LLKLSLSSGVEIINISLTPDNIRVHIE